MVLEKKMEKIDQRKEEDDETQREKEKNGAIFTAFDSLDSKFQSSKIGYFQDNFLDRMHDELMRKGLRPAKRPPIINKGYYIRILAFQRTISSFINASNGNIQLIFLGCGYDPFPLKLLQEWSTIRVDEADYPEVIENKRNIYSSWGESGQVLPHLFEVDLNEGEHLITTLTNNLLNMEIPTLIITECVLPYLHPESISFLISTFYQIFPCCAWLSYDLINLSDSFGKVMIRNMAAAGINIPGALFFQSKQNEIDCFLSNGWESCQCDTLLEYYNKRISTEEKASMSSIERLDEVEEWNIIMNHYSFLIASKGEQFSI